MPGFTFIDWCGEHFHFSYNTDDDYWWSDGLKCAEVYAMCLDAIRKYEKIGRIIWDK